MKKIILAALAIATMVSCAQDINLEEPTPTTKSREIEFSSGIQSRVEGNNWEAGDKVGIYMFSPFSNNVYNDNVEYEAANSGSFTTFDVVDGFDPIYTPEDSGEPFLIEAYYPYNPERAGYDSYWVDLSDQTDLKAIDFLSALWMPNYGPSQDIDNKVLLDFKHINTYVKLYIESTEEVGSLEGLRFELSGIQTVGNISGFGGSLEAAPAHPSTRSIEESIEYGTISNVVVNDGTSERQKRIDMILFSNIIGGGDVPMSLTNATRSRLGTDAQIHIYLGDEHYVAPFAAVLRSGYQQSYRVTIGKDEMKIGDATIRPWDGEDDETELPTLTPNDGDMTLEDFSNLLLGNKQLPESNKWSVNCYNNPNPTELWSAETCTMVAMALYNDNRTVSIDFYGLKMIPAESFKNFVTLNSIYATQVRTIGDNAFENCFSLNKIVADNVETIGNKAFKNCGNLNYAAINYTQTLGTNVFEKCGSLENISFYNLQVVPTSTFAGCSSLESVNLGTVHTIQAKAFEECTSLKYIELCTRDSETKIESIDATAFEGCDLLKTNLRVGEQNAEFIDEESETLKIGETVLTFREINTNDNAPD